MSGFSDGDHGHQRVRAQGARRLSVRLVVSSIANTVTSMANPIAAEVAQLRLVTASVYIAGPDALDPGYLDLLLGAQGQAIDARRGLWRRWLEPRPAGAEPLIATRFRIHRRSCQDLRNARPRPVTSLVDELRQGRSPCRGCKPLDKR